MAAKKNLDLRFANAPYYMLGSHGPNGARNESPHPAWIDRGRAKDITSIIGAYGISASWKGVVDVGIGPGAMSVEVAK